MSLSTNDRLREIQWRVRALLRLLHKNELAYRAATIDPVLCRILEFTKRSEHQATEGPWKEGE